MPSAPAGLARESADWPADVASIAAARTFLQGSRGTVAVACDSDVDGLSGALIVERTLRAAGAAPIVLPARRGEHVHRSGMRARITALRPARVVVVDMGSRPEPVLCGAPTLIVDHHDAVAGLPPDALVVNGFDRAPVAPSSVLAHVICRALPGAEQSAWLAALGAVADLGSAGAFGGVLGIRASGKSWSTAVALLNAARRAPNPDPTVALETLREADSVQDITSGRLPGTKRLEEYREQVRAEVDRCARVPPVVAGNVALLRFTSGAQVHPIVATRWTRRLQPRIVMAANDGYLPGRTNFAVRCAADVDLVAWLRGLPFRPRPDAEYANGHARATGGSLRHDEFESLLDALGFASTARAAQRGLQFR